MSKCYTGMAVGLMIGATAIVGQAQEASWADKIEFSGDFRFRFEYIDQDDQDDARERLRGRARLGASAEVNDEIKVHLRVASGGEDPVSSNESFDGGFTTKDFRLDRAYIDYSPAFAAGVEVWLGKFKNPWIQVSDLMWDTDLNPEGAVIRIGTGDSVKLLANAGVYPLEERSSTDDTYLYAAQVGAEGEVSDGVKVTAGVGYFHYESVQGFSPIFDEEDGFGNTVLEDEDGGLTYVNEYGVFEAVASVQADLGMPVKVFGNYLVNTEADSAGDTGFLFGVTAGKAKDPGSWEISYDYRDLEADATLGVFSDSDSYGGGTNGEGSRIKTKYQLAKNWQAAGTLFFNSIDPDGDDVDYTRLQLDLVAKF